MARHSRTLAKHGRKRPKRTWRNSNFKVYSLVAAGAIVLACAAAAPGVLHGNTSNLVATQFANSNARVQATAPPSSPTAGSNSDAALPSQMTGSEQIQLGNLLTAPQCTLNVPSDPLSSGLSQPWFLESATAACAENAQTGAFVQATILDPATGALSVYYPLVVPEGATPARTIVPPVLPPNAVVTIWTGFNGSQLKLAGPGAAYFVNFAQQSWANSPQFFQALRTAIGQGLVTVPPNGTAKDGLPCPTTRDFSIVDQDQSDNVPSSELVAGLGATAQANAANIAALPGATQLFNGSDEGVLESVDSALGCKQWMVPDQTDNNVLAPSAALNEQQAASFQGIPMALVPGLNDFVTSNGTAPPAGKENLFLQNLYRLQVGQPPTGNGNDTREYCVNLALTGAPRLQLDFDTESSAPTPAFLAGTGVNLALALAHRFTGTWANLNCTGLTGQPSPVTVTLSGNTAIAATFTPYRGPLFGLSYSGYPSGSSSSGSTHFGS
jgi:hypothetical protein